MIDETTASPGHAAEAASAQAPNAHGILVTDWVLCEAEAAAQGLPEPPPAERGSAALLAARLPMHPGRHSRHTSCDPARLPIFVAPSEAALAKKNVYDIYHVCS